MPHIRQIHMPEHVRECITAQAMPFYDTFSDTPEKTSGWGHNYFCSEDGGWLVFCQNKPHEHVCHICSHVYTGEPFDSTWVYLYRCRAFNMLPALAGLFVTTQDAVYLGYITKTLEFYAANYRRFRLHAKAVLDADMNHDVGGAGRISPQGLNEAIMLTKALLALDILRTHAPDCLSQSFLETIRLDLFEPAIDELLALQLSHVQNIKCWVNAAIGMAGLFFKVWRWTLLCFEGAYNIRRQLATGVTKDGFWYEGSIHYHYFTLEGVVSLLHFCKRYGADFGESDSIVKHMLTAGFMYAFDGGIFPNPNDGWPDVNLRTYAHVYYMAAQYFNRDTDVLGIIRSIEEMTVERVPLPLWDPVCIDGQPVERWLFAPCEVQTPQIRCESVLYKASNFAKIVSAPASVFLKFGHNGPSHAHPDRMTFELAYDGQMVSRDLSNAGYGSKICNEWHRMTAAHNTVVVDGKNHTYTDMGSVLEFTPQEIRARAQAYDGVFFERHMRLSADMLSDTFIVTGTHGRTCDYFLHIDCQLCYDMVESADLSFADNGYQYITDVRSAPNTLWVTVGKHTCGITLSGGDFYIAQTPDNPISKHRTTIIIRNTTDGIFNVAIVHNPQSGGFTPSD